MLKRFFYRLSYSVFGLMLGLFLIWIAGCSAAGVGAATWIGAGAGVASAGLTGVQIIQAQDQAKPTQDQIKPK